ncbi:hypothetical protein [Actinoplanes sp. DH11]|uniref:hypothetical protein n=1 Tax=Actinoplanes sp. DH11 TaxID=2857011 RepID=UPI001E42F062|nr:hypothetical protein [Actinoplanes sp. DH11]
MNAFTGIGAVSALHLEMLAPLLADPRYVPDFLTPPPDGTGTRFADELARVRGTPEADVRAHLDLLGAGTPLPAALLRLYEDPERHLGRLAVGRGIHPAWLPASADERCRWRVLTPTAVIAAATTSSAAAAR